MKPLTPAAELEVRAATRAAAASLPAAELAPRDWLANTRAGQIAVARATQRELDSRAEDAAAAVPRAVARAEKAQARAEAARENLRGLLTAAGIDY